ncbi:MAG: bifunctional biotin--[acetyl-CoA-carboxylase] ligase/biotin operon repressor BirA [Aestuariibacter sp.]
MKPTDIKNEIVKLLSANEFLSGEELGDELGMSRAAISKHVKGLQQVGLDIFSVPGRGYKLASGIDILCYDKISSMLGSHAGGLDVCNIVSSTNDIVKEDIRLKSNGHVCIAEAQTDGRGRRGRQWYSPFGANIYMSMVWHFENGFQAMSGLSLAIGVALCEALDDLGITGAQVKWPNDLLIANKKVAGVLIETEGYSDGSCSAIVGCGINFKMADDIATIDQPWTDLTSHANEQVDRNLVVAKIVEKLRRTLGCFERDGFGQFKALWEAKHAFANKTVCLTSGMNKFVGVAKGVDHSGALIIECINDAGTPELQHFHGGEVSVRSV